MWFNQKDININNLVELDDLHGYALPHAATKHTGDIISHTLITIVKSF